MFWNLKSPSMSYGIVWVTKHRSTKTEENFDLINSFNTVPKQQDVVVVWIGLVQLST